MTTPHILSACIVLSYQSPVHRPCHQLSISYSDIVTSCHNVSETHSLSVTVTSCQNVSLSQCYNNVTMSFPIAMSSVTVPLCHCLSFTGSLLSSLPVNFSATLPHCHSASEGPVLCSTCYLCQQKMWIRIGNKLAFTERLIEDVERAVNVLLI